MPKFWVEIKEVFAVTVEVEAEDEDGAREAASDLICKDEMETTYSYTMDSDDWHVEPA